MDTLHKIISLLESQNKTQKELVDYIGAGRGTFTKWKNNENKSYLKHVQKIAEFLGTSSAYLLRRTKRSGVRIPHGVPINKPP